MEARSSIISIYIVSFYPKVLCTLWPWSCSPFWGKPPIKPVSVLPVRTTALGLNKLIKQARAFRNHVPHLSPSANEQQLPGHPNGQTSVLGRSPIVYWLQCRGVRAIATISANALGTARAKLLELVQLELKRQASECACNRLVSSADQAQRGTYNTSSLVGYPRGISWSLSLEELI